MTENLLKCFGDSKSNGVLTII